MLNRLVLAALLCAGSAQAAVQTNLQPRDLDPNLPGHEAVYDDTTNLTWFVDPRGAGPGTWYQADDFIRSLDIGGTSGWRMAEADELLTLWGQYQAAGVAEHGAEAWYGNWALTADGGVGSHLFTVPGLGAFWLPDHGRLPSDMADDFELLPRSTDQFGPGLPKSACCLYVWAVHDGELVSSVPEQSTCLMVLSGLAALTACTRRYRSRRQ